MGETQLCKDVFRLKGELLILRQAKYSIFVNTGDQNGLSITNVMYNKGLDVECQFYISFGKQFKYNYLFNILYEMVIFYSIIINN